MVWGRGEDELGSEGGWVSSVWLLFVLGDVVFFWGGGEVLVLFVNTVRYTEYIYMDMDTQANKALRKQPTQKYCPDKQFCVVTEWYRCSGFVRAACYTIESVGRWLLCVV